MDEDAQVLAALGVLLTQLRTARRALEDVQRNTARYAGFEFARAFTEGARFGQPPMFDGALMVHVVNINDLAPGNSFGGFIEALFGGIGNFFGNLIGGAVGGTLSGYKLPAMIAALDRIVVNIGKIVDRLGLGEHAEKNPKTGKSESAPEAQARSGESLLTTLDGVRAMVREATALFQAASTGPDDKSGAAAAARTSQTPLTETGERWMAILNGVNILLDRAGRLADGLVILIPMAVGGIALLIANLGGIRRALLETVQFVLRSALILRGVLLTVIFETVASAARLAGSVVGILGTAIQSVLGAIFGVIRALMGAAFDALKTLTDALQAVVSALLEWLVQGVFNTLRAIGELTVFRTIDHLVRILPALLPAIYMLMNSAAMPTDVMGMLADAHKAGLAPPAPAAAAPGAPGTPGAAVAGAGTTQAAQIIGTFPDLKKILDPLGATLGMAVDATGESVKEEAKKGIDAVTGTLSGLAGSFDAAVRKEADFSRGIIDRNVGRIRGEAATLTDAITAPIKAEGPATGFEAIAKAYEGWLTGGGMAKVLDQVKTHFTDRPAGGEEAGAMRLLRGQYDRARASVEIDSVEIVLDPMTLLEMEPAEPSEWGPGDFPLHTDENVWLAVRRHERELDDRGIRPTDPNALG